MQRKKTNRTWNLYPIRTRNSTYRLLSATFEFYANLAISMRCRKESIYQSQQWDNCGEFIAANGNHARTEMDKRRCRIALDPRNLIFVNSPCSINQIRRYLWHGRTHEIRFSRFVYRSSELKAWAAELANKRSKGKTIGRDISKCESYLLSLDKNKYVFAETVVLSPEC